MTRKKIFYKDESPYYPGKFMIRANQEDFFLTHTEGSYHVICARLFNLSYANYLRMCRDCFGAEIIGKDSKYPVPYFKRSKELDALVENLNARANFVLQEREYPDYEAHAEVVKETNPEFYKEVTANG